MTYHLLPETYDGRLLSRFMGREVQYILKDRSTLCYDCAQERKHEIMKHELVDAVKCELCDAKQGRGGEA